MIARPALLPLRPASLRRQWLSLDKFQVLEPDRKRFPKLTRDTRAS